MWLVFGVFKVFWDMLITELPASPSSLSFLFLITHYYCFLILFFSLFPLTSAGNKGPVSGSQSPEEAVVEVPHKVHDVVSEARRTQDHYWWVWAGLHHICNLLWRKSVNSKTLHESANWYLHPTLTLKHLEIYHCKYPFKNDQPKCKRHMISSKGSQTCKQTLFKSALE